MSHEQQPEAPEMEPYRKLMRKIAIGVLVVGLSISAMVFVMAPSEAEDDHMGMQVASIHNSKKYLLELERIGGKAAVFAAEINEWYDSLWHGKRLAGTLAVLSIGASLLCFLLSKAPPLED